MKTIQLKIEVDGTEKIIDDLDLIDKELKQIKKDSDAFNGKKLKEFGEGADEAAKSVEKLGKNTKNIGNETKKSEENLVKLSSGAKLLAGSIDIAEAAISKLGLTNEGTEQQILKLQQTLTLTRGIVDFSEGLEELGFGLKKAKDNSADLEKAALVAGGALTDAGDKSADAASGIDTLGKATKDTAKNTGDLDKATKSTGKGLEDTGKKTGGLSKGLKGLGDVVKANPILTLAGIFVSLLAATGKLDDLIKILGKTFGEVFDALQPVLDILTDVLIKALDPLLKVLGPVLVPILKLALIPIQLLGKAFEFLSPLIIGISEGVAGLALILGELANIAGKVIKGALEFIGVSVEQETQQKNTARSAAELKEAYDKQKDAQEKLNQVGQLQIDLLKAQGAGIAEVEKAELDLARTRTAAAIENAQRIIDEAELAKKKTGITDAELKAQQEIIDAATQDKIVAQKSLQILEAQQETNRKKRAEEASKVAKDARKKSNEDAAKALSDAQKKELDKIKEGLAEQERQQQLAYENAKQQLIKNFEDEGATIEEQEKGLADFEEEQADLRLQKKIEFLKKEQVIINNNTKLLAKDREGLVEDLEAQISALETQASENRIAKRRKEQQDELNETTKFYEDLAAAREQGLAQQTLQETEGYLNDLTILNERFRSGEIKSEEEFQQELEDLDKEYEDRRRQNELKAAQQRLIDAENQQAEILSTLEEGTQEYEDAVRVGGAQITAARQEVADKEVEIQQNATDEILDTRQKELEAQQKLFDGITGSLDKFGSDLQNLTQDASENFDSLGFSILNSFSDVAAGASELFTTLSADVKDLGPNIDASTEKTASNAEKLAAAFGAVGAALASIGGILQEQTQQRLDELQTQTDAETTALEEQQTAYEENLEAQLEAGIITQEQADTFRVNSEKNTQTQLDAINKAAVTEETNLKRKAFQQEKSIRIAQAVAQGAQAALAGYASGLAIPVVGPAVGAAYAAVAGVITAAQVAIIAKQKFPEPGQTSTGGGGGGFQAPPSAALIQTQGGTNFQNDIFTGAQQSETISRVRPPIIRAYVTESDITSTQNRIDRIQNQSEL
jgi:hypothetical protein